MLTPEAILAARMRRATLLGLALTIVLVSSYGPSTNDEMEQNTAFHNLRNGHLLIEEIPPQHYEVPWVPGGIAIPTRTTTYAFGSTALNVVGLPMAAVVYALDLVAPLWVWTSLAVVSMAWVLFRVPPPWTGPWRRRALLVAGGAATFALLGMGFRGTAPDVPYQLAPVALQWTNIALFLVIAWLLWDLVQRRTKNPYATSILVLAAALGPLIFWADSQKYHTLTILLVTLAMWLRDRATAWQRIALLGAVAGICAWVQQGVGAVLVGGLALAELAGAIRRRHEWRATARRWGIMAGGLLLGLTPMFIENQLTWGSPWYSFYFAEGAGASVQTGNETGDAGNVSQPSLFDALVKLPSIILSVMHWDGPGDFVNNLASGYIWSGAEGNPVPVFLLSPFLAAAAVGIWILATNAKRDSTATKPNAPRAASDEPQNGSVVNARIWGGSTLAAGIMATQTILYTNTAVLQGTGYDMRLYVHVIPALAVLAADALSGPMARIDGAAYRTLMKRAGILLLVSVAFMAVLTNLGANFLGASGGTFSQYARNYYIFVLVLLMAPIIVIGIASRVQWVPYKPRQVFVWFLAASLALTGLWTAQKIVPDPSAVVNEDGEFVSMLIPAMEPVSHWATKNLYPPVRIPPIVIGGVLIYHPEYGRCDVEPNPCPEYVPENRTA